MCLVHSIVLKIFDEKCQQIKVLAFIKDISRKAILDEVGLHCKIPNLTESLVPTVSTCCSIYIEIGPDEICLDGIDNVDLKRLIHAVERTYVPKIVVHVSQY